MYKASCAHHLKMIDHELNPREGPIISQLPKLSVKSARFFGTVEKHQRMRAHYIKINRSGHFRKSEFNCFQCIFEFSGEDKSDRDLGAFFNVRSFKNHGGKWFGWLTYSFNFAQNLG